MAMGQISPPYIRRGLLALGINQALAKLQSRLVVAICQMFVGCQQQEIAPPASLGDRIGKPGQCSQPALAPDFLTPSRRLLDQLLIGQHRGIGGFGTLGKLWETIGCLLVGADGGFKPGRVGESFTQKKILFSRTSFIGESPYILAEILSSTSIVSSPLTLLGATVIKPAELIQVGSQIRHNPGAGFMGLSSPVLPLFAESFNKPFLFLPDQLGCVRHLQ